MQWGEALARTFLAEVEAFGEDVLFRGNVIKASVGSSQETKALELSGYFANHSLQVVIPRYDLIGLNSKPSVNEILEIKGQGYRIHSVRRLEEDEGYDLVTELIPEYEPKGEIIQDPQYAQPNPITELTVGVFPYAPSEVEVLARPLIPSDVQVQQSPLAPSDITAEVNYVDLYIVSGQSNAHGHSEISDLTGAQVDDIAVGFYSSWNQNTSDASTAQRYSDYVDTMQLGKTRGDGGETTLDSDYFGIEWGFAKKLEELNTSGSDIGIVKYAVGASTIDVSATLSHWDTLTADECFDAWKSAIADAITKVKARGKNPRWKGLVWYQGESNAGMQPWEYKDKLDTLYKAMIQELGVADLPAVFCAPANASGEDLNCNNGHVSYARSADYLNYIKISDYHDGVNNNVHLSAQNMYDAGQAVGVAMDSATAQTATEVEFEPSTNIDFWIDGDSANLVTEDSSTHVVTSVEARAGNIDILPMSKDANPAEIIHEHNAIALRDCFTMSHDREYLVTDGLVTMPTGTQDWFVVARPNGINNGQDAIWATNGGRAITLIPVGGNKYVWYWQNTAVSSPQGLSSLDGELSLFSVRWNFNGSHVSTWFNGEQRDSQRASTASLFTMVDVRHHFMAQYGATNTTDGNFCEAIVSTSTANRLEIEGYLAHKWGIQNKLPQTHAYRYYAP